MHLGSNRRRHSVLPGFGLSLGYVIFYLGLIVILPLAALATKAASLSWDAVTAPRVLAAYKLTFGVSLAAALVNVVFGCITAWTLVRYRFPGKRIFDALVDIPFALPTAVSGIALTTLYSANGWFGQYLYSIGIHSCPK